MYLATYHWLDLDLKNSFSRSFCNRKSNVVYIFQHFPIHWEKQKCISDAFIMISAVGREGSLALSWNNYVYWEEIDSDGITIQLDRKLRLVHCTRICANIASSLAFAIYPVLLSKKQLGRLKFFWYTLH